MPNEPDQFTYLIGSELLLKRGHAIATFGNLFEKVRIGMTKRMTFTQ